MKQELTGLWPPVSTPFSADGSVDLKRLVSHGKALIADGSTGLAVLGTTSEANSLTLDERRSVIDACVAGGISASKLMPGTGASALGDAVSLTRHAGEIGAAAVLLLPPFYYKKVSDEGLYTFVAQLIERVGASIPRIMLYHIPQVAAAGWSTELVARLRKAFPEVIVGMKDSSGDAEHTKKMIDAFPGFIVFPGAEVYLLKALSWGAPGCISASANVNARGISQLIARWKQPGDEERQEELNAVRKALEKFVMIPALKAVLATRYRDENWLTVRPPLVRMTDADRKTLLADPPIARLLALEPT